jgi:hypothetical protein
MKKTVILLTTLCLCFHLFTVSLCAAPSVSARSAVVIDAKTGNIVEERLAETDKDFPMYFNKALEWLKKALKLNDIPTEYTMMWY